MLAVPVTGYPQLYSLTFNVAWFASLDVCMRGGKREKGYKTFLIQIKCNTAFIAQVHLHYL